MSEPRWPENEDDLVEFSCPHCGIPLGVSSPEDSGTTIECEACGQDVTVP